MGRGKRRCILRLEVRGKTESITRIASGERGSCESACQITNGIRNYLGRGDSVRLGNSILVRKKQQKKGREMYKNKMTEKGLKIRKRGNTSDLSCEIVRGQSTGTNALRRGPGTTSKKGQMVRGRRGKEDLYHHERDRK